MLAKVPANCVLSEAFLLGPKAEVPGSLNDLSYLSQLEPNECDIRLARSLVLEYTKIAQRLERVFIKAWKRFFPPADLEDSGEDARQEELHCIDLLGALDKKIKDDLAVRLDVL